MTSSPDAPAAAALPATTHLTPARPDRADAWHAGVSFEAFLPTAEKNAGLWQETGRRAALPAELLARAAAVPGAWKLLVLSADWCGDAANTVPVLARFAEVAPGLDLRLLERDEHLDLMDEHLTDGRSRSIPAAILLDGDLRERAWWGPRPAELQAWVLGEGQEHASEERYRRVRQWYARDKGRTTLEEVVAMLEAAGEEAEGSR